MGNKIIVEFDKDKYKSNICSKCDKRKSCTQTTLRVFICGYEKHHGLKKLIIRSRTMENLDTSTPKKRDINDTSTAEMCNIGTPKRLSRWQRRNIKFGRNLWKQRNRRLKG